MENQLNSKFVRTKMGVSSTQIVCNKNIFIYRTNTYAWHSINKVNLKACLTKSTIDSN